MRGNSLFWGAILVLIGVLLLLSNLGILTVNVWGLFWPALMILAGVWFIFGVVFRGAAAAERRSVPLDGATRARVGIYHGAGRLGVHTLAEEGALFTGDFGGGVDLRTRRDGDLLDVELRVPTGNWGAWGLERGERDWSLGFNPHTPLSFHLETGASETRLDLTDLLVSDVRIQTGASATEVSLPARAGLTQVEIHSGAASTRLHVPEGVAARIHFSGGLSTINVDTNRFPYSGGEYISADFQTNPNRVDMRLEAGVGSVEVR